MSFTTTCSDFACKYFNSFNHLRSTLRLSLGRCKMSLYEKTYVILTIITFMMALSCLAHLDQDL